jgi:hypothetical protein
MALRPMATTALTAHCAQNQQEPDELQKIVAQLDIPVQVMIEAYRRSERSLMRAWGTGR